MFQNEKYGSYIYIYGVCAGQEPEHQLGVSPGRRRSRLRWNVKTYPHTIAVLGELFLPRSAHQAHSTRCLYVIVSMRKILAEKFLVDFLAFLRPRFIIHFGFILLISSAFCVFFELGEFSNSALAHWSRISANLQNEYSNKLKFFLLPCNSYSTKEEKGTIITNLT